MYIHSQSYTIHRYRQLCHSTNHSLRLTQLRVAGMLQCYCDSVTTMLVSANVAAMVRNIVN